MSSTGNEKIGLKKIFVNLVIVLIAIGLILYPIKILIGEGGYLSYIVLRGVDYHRMLLEIAIWILIAMIGYKKKNILWLIGELLLFSYLHYFLLPIVFSTLYLIGTCLLGEMFNSYTIKYDKAGRLCMDCLIGMMLLTIGYAVLSVFKIGGIPNLRIFAVAVFAICVIVFLKKSKSTVGRNIISGIQMMKVSSFCYIFCVIVMVFLMIQIGKANLCIDYDAMWYGLRSQFTLNNSTGIYDPLKLSPFVYVYSKGYEIYALPFSGLKSYGFVYAVNISLTMAVLGVVYKISEIFMSRDKSVFSVVLLSAIPGVMNMSTAAKPDICTLLVQVIMIYFVLLYLKDKRRVQLLMIWTCFIYSQSLKGTAAIFSTSILVAFFAVSIFYRIRTEIKDNGWAYVLPVISIVDLIFVWGRTYLLTGLPANTLWASLFTMLGMEYRYPYNASASFVSMSNLFSLESIKAASGRIKGFFLGPITADASHIVIAWGTTLCTLLAIMIILIGIFNVKKVFRSLKASPQNAMIALLFIGELIGCLICLVISGVPDGNYFQLYYVSVIICGNVVLQSSVFSKSHVSKKIGVGIVGMFLGFNFIVTAAVNWAWVSKFCERDWLNKGYYNHEQQIKKQINARGCYEIYDILAKKKDTKVFSFGEHPYDLLFPCVIEDAWEVRTWGNAETLSTPEEFIKLVEYQKYEYIYIWPGYITEESVDYQNIKKLFDERMISDVLVESGNILLTIDHDIKQSSEGEWNEFKRAIQSL